MLYQEQNQQKTHSLSINMLNSNIACLVLAASRIAQAQYSSTTTFTFQGNTLPTGLARSGYTVNDNDGATKYDHEFEPSMAYVQDGFLNLLVPGGQKDDSTIWSAEVVTDFTVSAARVDTWAILTENAGVCNGNRKHLVALRCSR